MDLLSASAPLGARLRAWRQHRRLSQLDLALGAGNPARHLSFLETGRARPSREMVLKLADNLAVPLRERNALLVAAGFAPTFPERALDDPGLEAARRAVDLVLAGHEPFPALAVDRPWTLIGADAAVPPMLQGTAESLLAPPVNVPRLSLHPDGLAPRIVNLGGWRNHLLDRLRRQIDLTADPVLTELLSELNGYPVPAQTGPERLVDFGGVAVPFRVQTGAVELAFYSATTVFGTPLDITLSELAIEAFFPADQATAHAMWR